ncbi:MAG: STAS domain-containing protein [Pseudomonadales bacterium]|nr:STAS domain-containing protein [Pseudomonadales bacterium]
MVMGRILFAEQDGVNVLKFTGDVRVTLGPTIGAFLNSLKECKEMKSIIIDLTETEGIDSTSLGLLAKISLQTQESFHTVPTIVSTNEDITRILMSMGFDKVFVIIKEPLATDAPLGELPVQVANETALREQVLEAHKVLMGLNEYNRNAFQDLVVALEHEKHGHPISYKKKRAAGSH